MSRAGRRVARPGWMATTVVTLVGLAATPATAAPPASGVVVEGISVPGVDLGANRTEVQAAWGAPTFCQSGSKSGDRALCTWQGTDGSVDLSFVSRKGRNPTGGDHDVVAGADWTGFPGWVTTAGVSAPQALSDPESVPPAYPNAQVFRYGDGHLLEVLDNHLGVEVYWSPLPYTGEFVVTMFIFRPRA
jgi:hypothetical protein